MKISRRAFGRVAIAGGIGAYLAACGGGSGPEQQTAVAELPGERTDGNISLTAAQVEHLQKTVTDNPDAQAMYLAVQKVADEALAANPQPLPTIHHQGLSSSSSEYQQAREALKDTDRVLWLGTAYAVQNDAKYASRAKDYVLAWAQVHQPNGNPIDETTLTNMMLGYDLVKGTFSDAERSQVAAYFRKIAETQMNTPLTIGNTAKNNWQAHRLNLVGTAGVLLQNQAMTDFATAGFKAYVNGSLYPDGTSFDYKERDALEYHTYGLMPLLALARTSQRAGNSLYSYSSPTGASLPKSVEFLKAAMFAQPPHIEFANTTIASDAPRKAKAEAYNPANAIGVLENDFFFNPADLPIIQQIKPTNHPSYPTLNTMLYDMQR